MYNCRRYLTLVSLFSLFMAMLPAPVTVRAQDLVATENVAGGSSVFVFRESRKSPQARGAGGRASSREAGGGGPATSGRSSRTNTQIAAAAAKRRQAASKKRAAIVAANHKLALSNTFTAKAEGFLDNNQTDDAITNFRSALAQNPKNTRASEGLSNALMVKGIDAAGENNNVAGIVYFDEAIKRDKSNDVAYAKLGAIYDASGNTDKAIANYEKALTINPEYSMLYPPLGLAYIDAGEIAKAEAASQKSTAAGVDTVEARFLSGLIHFKQNRNEEALAAFDRTVALDGRFVEAHYSRGQVFDRMGKPDQAIAAYKNTLNIAPTYSFASFDLGVDYYNAGDYNNALVAYQQTVKNDPKNYQAHANLASTYRQLERYPEANAEYEIVSAGIKTADLYSEWGYCLGKTNEWDKSVARLETAKQISPTAIDNSNVGWAYYNEGTANTTANNKPAADKDYAMAKTNLEVAVKQDPKLDAAYLNLGSTHNALGEFQLAVNVLQVALGLHSNWLIATNQLGLGYRGLNDMVNAVATFKRVVDLDGRNTFGLYNLGEAYNASGNKKDAKKINDRLKKIDPNLASRLDGVITGKIINGATQQFQQKIPKVPRLPF
jgi:tetratricopeptide (TPR) repeat protein